MGICLRTTILPGSSHSSEHSYNFCSRDFCSSANPQLICKWAVCSEPCDITRPPYCGMANTIALAAVIIHPLVQSHSAFFLWKCTPLVIITITKTFENSVHQVFSLQSCLFGFNAHFFFREIRSHSVTQSIDMFRQVPDQQDQLARLRKIAPPSRKCERSEAEIEEWPNLQAQRGTSGGVSPLRGKMRRADRIQPSENPLINPRPLLCLRPLAIGPSRNCNHNQNQNQNHSQNQNQNHVSIHTDEP